MSKVLVLGDLIIDKYVSGQVERISPEAPVPVLNPNNFYNCLGGAGNVAKCISVLNGNVDFIFNSGNSFDIKEFENEKNINLIPFSDNRVTAIKTRYLSGSNHLLRVDQEEVYPLLESVENELISYLRNNLKNYDYVIISDYDKGFLTPKLLETISSVCRVNNIKTYLDPKFRDFNLYKNFDVIKCNKIETEFFANKKIFNEKELKREIKKIHKNLNCKIFISTLSSEGHICFDGSKFNKFKTKAEEVYDVSGAGDSFISAFSHFYNVNQDIKTSSFLASVASAISIQKMGCYAPSISEINKKTDENKN